MNGNKPKPCEENLTENTRAQMATELPLGGGPAVIFFPICLFNRYPRSTYWPTPFKALGTQQLIALPVVSRMCLMKMLLFNGKKNNYF